MHDKVKKKMQNQSGESIGETLIALLIAALALVMLAGAISASSGTISKCRNTLDLYYDNMERVVNRSSTSTSYYSRGDGTVTIKDQTNIATGSASYKIADQNVNTYYYANKGFNKNPVIAYNMK